MSEGLYGRFGVDMRWLETRQAPWLGGGVLLMALLILSVMGLSTRAFWDYHEPYVAGIVWDMAHTGDWVIPRLNGLPYLEKPPLYYGLAAMLARWAGAVSPMVTRLPSLLAGLGWVAWCAWVVGKLWGFRKGLWTAAILGTTPLFLIQSREGVVDLVTATLVGFGLGCALLALPDRSERQRYANAFWVAVGLAFLSKGIYGMAMLIFPVGCSVFWLRDRAVFRAFLKAWPGMVIAGLLIACWLLPLARVGGSSLLVDVLVRNSYGRFAADSAMVPLTGRYGEHVETISFYLRRLPGNVLPWTFVQIAALVLGVRRLVQRRMGRIEGFVLIVALAMLIILHLSQAKRSVYALPLLMPLAILATWVLPRLNGRFFAHSPGILLSTSYLVGGVWLGATGRLHVGAASGLVLLGGLGWWVILHWHARTARVWVPVALWCLGGFITLGQLTAQSDARWQAVQAPFETASRMDRLGIPIFGHGLSETQTGWAVVALNRRISIVDGPKAAELLERPEPVALLVESRHAYPSLRSKLKAGLPIPFAIERDPRDWDRAPVLLVNEMARTSWRMFLTRTEGQSREVAELFGRY